MPHPMALNNNYFIQYFHFSILFLLHTFIVHVSWIQIFNFIVIDYHLSVIFFLNKNVEKKIIESNLPARRVFLLSSSFLLIYLSPYATFEFKNKTKKKYFRTLEGINNRIRDRGTLRCSLN